MKKMLFLLMSSLLIGSYAYSQDTEVKKTSPEWEEARRQKIAAYLSTVSIKISETTEKSDNNASFTVDLVFDKGFERKMVLYITPTLNGKECSELKLDGKDTNKIVVQGDVVLENNPVVSNTNGEKLSYKYVYNKRKLNYKKLGFKVVGKVKNTVVAQGAYNRSGDHFAFTQIK